MTTKKITIQDVIDAAKKNGYPWGKGKYIEYNIYGDNHNEVLSACLVGQMALNLNVDPSTLLYRLDNTISQSDITRGTFFPSELWRYNDYHANSYQEAVDYAEARLKPFAELEFEIAEMAQRK